MLVVQHAAEELESVKNVISLLKRQLTRAHTETDGHDHRINRSEQITWAEVSHIPSDISKLKQIYFGPLKSITDLSILYGKLQYKKTISVQI